MRQAMIFQMGGENYGLDIAKVREIMEPVPLFFVPRAPSWVEGALNRHGRIITVIDLSSFLGLTPAGRNTFNMIVILDDPLADIGFLVETRLEVVSEWEKMAAEGPSVKNKYVGDVFTSEGRIISIIDIEKIISNLDASFV